ncbi:hypothetical protein BRC68_03690 [Halobacteriales archaeon QH_6_64_20]|nr:MAG: hypothetical protein BRC68_03690 [Halobacteriales archaeon QH_6_64_20]
MSTESPEGTVAPGAITRGYRVSSPTGDDRYRGYTSLFGRSPIDSDSMNGSRERTVSAGKSAREDR